MTPSYTEIGEFHAARITGQRIHTRIAFGNAGSKWKWRYDDLDTIFDTDNQGQAKKGYYVEFHDTYDTGWFCLEW